MPKLYLRCRSREISGMGPMTILIQPELKAAAEAAAKHHGITLAAYVRRVIAMSVGMPDEPRERGRWREGEGR